MKKFYIIWNQVAARYDRYVTKSRNYLLKRLQQREKKALFSLIQDSLTKKDVILIEIGSGTGRLLFKIVNEEIDRDYPYKIRYLIGLDVSPNMITVAESNLQRLKIADSWENKIIFLNTNATQGYDSIKKYRFKGNHNSFNFKNALVITCCVLNTLGVIEPRERSQIVREMAKLAGSDGIIFISVFNAESFKNYAYTIYKPLEKMVGFVDQIKSFNMSKHVFKTEDLYYSKWFNEEDILNLIKTSLKNTNFSSKKLDYTKINNIGIIVKLQ